MALSQEGSTERVAGNFHGLLAMLAAEYQRVCVGYSDLRAECSRLQARLEFKEAKEDSNTTCGSINLREDCSEYECYSPRPNATKYADTCPAARLPEVLHQESLSGNGHQVHMKPHEESLNPGLRPEASVDQPYEPTFRRTSIFELSELRRSPGDPSHKPPVQEGNTGSKDVEKNPDKFQNSSVARGSIAKEVLSFFRFRRSTSKSPTRMTLNDALRGANLRIASSSRLVVNPERSKFIRCWDQVTIVALAFVAVVTPVQVAMMDSQLDALFFINVVIDMVFLFDMILQFFLMYPVKTNYGIALEHRHSKIVTNYVKGWLILDLASILPFDVISVLGDFENLEKVKAVKVIRLLRLLKLARMRKVTRLFRRLEMRMAIAYQRLALVKFLTMLFLVTHWMANLWALTLVLEEEETNVPRWVDLFESIEVNVGTKTKDSIWKLYLTCLYFTSYTITSVGYGDIGPQNITERIVCTMMIFVSGITWALLIAQVCSIVSSMDSEDQNFRKVMDELNYMMDSTELPMSMRRRLRSFFLSNKASARHARYLKIVDSMSPALRGEVCLEMNRMWIQKVSFLKSFSEEGSSELGQGGPIQTFMVDVSRSLIAQVYAQGEAFGQPQVLYILNRGLASHMGRVRRSGAVWGTDFVLSNPAFLEPCGSFTLTYVEVTCLERGTFFGIVNKHEVACPHISKVVRRYSGWLALQRWIFLEASRRINEMRASARVNRYSLAKAPSGDMML